MQSAAKLFPKITVGVDVGDRKSVTCEINAAGEVVKRDRVATAAVAIERYFGGRRRCRVVMEVGTHSPWMSRQIEAYGHEVIVANGSEVYGRGRRKKRNDRMDAEFLARQGRADCTLLHPIQHRRIEAHLHLEWIRARDQLVQVRSKLVNHMRGTVKSVGGRISRCSTEAFAHRAVWQIPQELRSPLTPLLSVIDDLSARIREYDNEIERLIQQSYPEAVRLQQIKGVGPLTALAFVLLIDDPKRFSRIRDVGAFFGLVPRLDESSTLEPQLRITKAGDALGRRLLVSSAHYILGPFGPDCDLRRHGEKIAARGGKNAKKRAAVAVARKLSVLLLRLWISDAEYDPQRTTRRQRTA
jgi:transposase